MLEVRCLCFLSFVFAFDTGSHVAGLKLLLLLLLPPRYWDLQECVAVPVLGTPETLGHCSISIPKVDEVIAQWENACLVFMRIRV